MKMQTGADQTCPKLINQVAASSFAFVPVPVFVLVLVLVLLLVLLLVLFNGQDGVRSRWLGTCDQCLVSGKVDVRHFSPKWRMREV